MFKPLLLNEFYQDKTFIIVAIIAASVIAIFLVVIFSIAMYRHSCRRAVKELSDRYDSIHDTFSTDCSNMIKRIETIASNNHNYSQVSDSTHSRFSQILNDNDKSCYVAVESLKKLIGDKNYKGIKTIIDSTKVSMDNFSKESIELNNDLQAILKREDDFRSMAVILKEKLRKLRDAYNENLTALESLSDSFDMLFNHLSNDFVKFEDLLNAADYQNAQSMLPNIEQLIDAANKVMTDLPYLNTLADKVIPGKIEELNNSYHEMESKNYPLHHLLLKTNIEKMNNDLQRCKEKLANLSTNGVADCFNNITMQITEYFNDFEKEKIAKQEFDSLQGTIVSSTYQAEKQYANLKNSLPSYARVYQISPTYIAQIDVIKDMIDDMSTKKRVLDGYINSSTKQPYSMLVTTMKELKQKIDKIQKAFDDFHTYLIGLKKDSDKAYSFIRTAFESLKVAESQLRSFGVASISEVYNTRILNAVESLTKIDDFLKQTPIDVMQLNSLFNSANDEVNQILHDVEENKTLMNRAETLIVYDNKYRVDSLDAKTKLVTVEKAFWEGDFSRASAVATEIYRSETSVEK